MKKTKKEQAILNFLQKESERLDGYKADYRGTDTQEHLNFGAKMEACYISCAIESIINGDEEWDVEEKGEKDVD